MTWNQIEEIFVASGARYPTMIASARAVKASGSTGRFIETGTYRGCVGDGLSTYVFSALAEHFGETLTSIDIDAGHIKDSVEFCARKGIRNVNHVTEDSVAYISRESGLIRFLYLDSFDYIEGQEHLAQMHNLAEVAAAIGKMAERAVVLCDDASLTGGGKPLLTIEWLVSRGWKLVMKGEQVLFTNWNYEPKAIITEAQQPV